ncbi:hypothetical protein FNV43_RR04212 [Rhamnella rubrinervis]|uniref:Uncharacterized protein n=1 Tax=Rhamnella rubrinervis TaxID=2594499 RepID=A0A8K0MPD2_9ROSA|nr:hypothetical protein FNV43_RR04212 [Rhamnella rubrinervis]
MGFRHCDFLTATTTYLRQLPAAATFPHDPQSTSYDHQPSFLTVSRRLPTTADIFLDHLAEAASRASFLRPQASPRRWTGSLRPGYLPRPPEHLDAALGSIVRPSTSSTISGYILTAPLRWYRSVPADHQKALHDLFNFLAQATSSTSAPTRAALAHFPLTARRLMAFGRLPASSDPLTSRHFSDLRQLPLILDGFSTLSSHFPPDHRQLPTDTRQLLRPLDNPHGLEACTTASPATSSTHPLTSCSHQASSLRPLQQLSTPLQPLTYLRLLPLTSGIFIRRFSTIRLPLRPLPFYGHPTTSLTQATTTSLWTSNNFPRPSGNFLDLDILLTVLDNFLWPRSFLWAAG